MTLSSLGPLLLVIALDTTVVAHQCQNAAAKTECYEEVMDAMLHGFARNPTDFIGLSIKSSFSDFQAYFHNTGMHGCPRPCIGQEQPCVKFGPGYPGMPDVNWAKQVGIPEHPEWYPDLPYPASDKQIAQVLYMHGVQSCPRPCEDDEQEGHFVPVGDAPVYADSEGWLTSTTVTITRTRTNTDTATSSTATTATTTTTTQTTVTMTSITIPPPVWLLPTTVKTTMQPATASTTTRLPTQAATTLMSIAPTAEPPRPLQATTTVFATKPVTTAPASTSSVTTHEESCFKSGTSLSLLDAAGYTPVSTDTTKECQAHCKSAAKADAEIGHFLFYEPLRTCHCPPSAAFEVAVGPEFVSGPLTCDVLLVDASADISMPTAGVSSFLVVAGSGAFAVAAVLGASAMALRRRRARDAEVMLLDEESGGLELTGTWPDYDSALE
eukprot:TRINITY_DN996_c1_g1_i1.p1 TRINITY_DN996_c1_g1~~TRINITY_DN996_c1_g1_i1.p1  ORF type:complete len:439 (+),score=62.31 TRINITY_DN996_c1_g1_i1:88-1404(+)